MDATATYEAGTCRSSEHATGAASDPVVSHAGFASECSTPYRFEWQRAQVGIARNSARRYAVYAAARWQSQPSVPPDPIQKPGVTMSQKIPRKKSPL